MLKPHEPADDAEHDEDEDQAGGVEAQHQLPSESSVPTPYLPMVNAMAPKAPIGATFITMPTMPKKTCAVWSMMPSSGLPRSPSAVQREGEQDGEEQHLQDLALGEGADHGGRDDVHEEVDGALLAGLGGVGCDRLGVERCRVDVHAGAGLPQVDDDQADDQRERGHRPRSRSAP